MAELIQGIIIKCIFVNKKGIMGKLKELKDKLKSFEFAINNQYQLPVVKEMVQKEIEKVKAEIKSIEIDNALMEAIFGEPIKIKPKKVKVIDVINYHLSAVGLSFDVVKNTIFDPLFHVPKSAFANLPKKTYYIVTSKDDPKPRKIRVTDKTEKTIVYVNVATQTQSDRMFISDFLANYTIHESFD